MLQLWEVLTNMTGYKKTGIQSCKKSKETVCLTAVTVIALGICFPPATRVGLPPPGQQKNIRMQADFGVSHPRTTNQVQAHADRWLASAFG